MSALRALVTGGSGGIGAEICRRLAADGRHVVVHAHRHLDAARTLAADIVARGGSAEALAFDVTDAAAARAALESLLERGPVQILVNNAGTHDDAAFPGMREAQWKSVIDVSLHGFFHVTQPLVLPMLRTRWGRIVNMASVSAVLGNRGQANYAAAKGALISATRTLALELGKRGVTVNAVAPGLIETAMSASFPAERIRELVPLQRAGTAAEVAELVAFLASDRAAYITGQTIPINGGMA
ncbi:MAG: 3-oxoacyl-ACP reductase FabG [Betaproteobacteria bacterium]|nr:3-oxoacyl-ACP reductase FabG [Betaproteobacteria bacterium]MDH5222457.1 3-oxoacyl-ACP reductase FabG [Betaproteobacteria bacterium]MDH5350226.1 3-oxoacyl-ACP reductase FabG [Betaproteobacteria bacterium]